MEIASSSSRISQVKFFLGSTNVQGDKVNDEDYVLLKSHKHGNVMQSNRVQPSISLEKVEDTGR